MPLYVGSQKLCPIETKIVEIPVPTGNYKAGTVVADENGVVTFPKLEFEPTMITIWNVRQRDLKAEKEEDGEEWDPEWLVRYIHSGFMLFAINYQGTWVSQGMTSNSGCTYISNDSFGYGSCITDNGDGTYSYRMHRDGYYGGQVAGEEFRYAIYG